MLIEWIKTLITKMIISLHVIKAENQPRSYDTKGNLVIFFREKFAMRSKPNIDFFWTSQHKVNSELL